MVQELCARLCARCTSTASCARLLLTPPPGKSMHQRDTHTHKHARVHTHTHTCRCNARTRMDPFLRAKLTSSVSWARVAAAPVGLLGEQKKMMSARCTCGVLMSVCW